MKKWYGKLTGLLMLTLVCALLCALVPASALKAADAGSAGGEGGNAESKENGGYTYTVRFYSGEQADFSDGSDVYKIDSVDLNGQVSFDTGMIALPDDSKYYVKGIRKAGRDNNTTGGVDPSSIHVTEDADYVVAYGIKGKMVAYTVNFVNDATGETLAKSRTAYGNVGDKPIVAFLYVDGYLPQAYNLTKTLVENEAQNVFTFRYTPIEGAAPPANVEEAEGEGAEGEAGAAGADADAGAAGAGAGAPLVPVPDAEVPLADQPEDLVDLDDQDVPLANKLLEGLTEDGSLLENNAVRIGALGVAALGFLLLFLHKRKKKEEEEAVLENHPQDRE